MFDKYEIRAGDQHHHHHRSEVHEHRAPTDDSVKLLREMEQAALDKVMGTFRLEGCEVDCVLVHQRDHMNDEHRFRVRYKMGRTERSVDHAWRPPYGVKEPELSRQCFEELLDVLAKDMALHLLAQPFAVARERAGFRLD